MVESMKILQYGLSLYYIESIVAFSAKILSQTASLGTFHTYAPARALVPAEAAYILVPILKESRKIAS